MADHALVQKTWATVYKNPETNAKIIFIQLFKEHPEYEQMFTRYKARPDQPLDLNDPAFMKHAKGNVLDTLSFVIANLDKPDVLQPKLKEVGENHAKRKMTKKHFDDMHHVLIIALKSILGAEFNPAVEKAWNAALASSFGVLVDAMEAKSKGK